MLGDDIVVEVIEVSGSSVRVGIAAPQSVPVYREEIWRAVKEENAGSRRARSAPPSRALTLVRRRPRLTTGRARSV